jgi:hypothetical protein
MSISAHRNNQVSDHEDRVGRYHDDALDDMLAVAGQSDRKRRKTVSAPWHMAGHRLLALVRGFLTR